MHVVKNAPAEKVAYVAKTRQQFLTGGRIPGI